MARLRPDRFVVAYEDFSVALRGTVRIATISGTSNLTFGSAQRFSLNDGGASMDVESLGTRKIVVAYRDNSNGDKGTARIGLVSGDEVVFAPRSVWAGNGGAAFIQIARLTPTKILISYRDDDNAFRLAAIVADISGTDIAYGPEFEITTTDSAAGHDSCVLTESEAVFTYHDGDRNGVARVATISGDDVTLGPEHQIFSAGASATAAWTSCYAKSPTSFVVAYSADDGTPGSARVGAVGGTDVTFGPAAQFSSTFASGIRVDSRVDTSRFWIAYRDNGSSNHGTARMGCVSGLDITFGPEAKWLPANGALDTDFEVLEISSTKAAVAYRDASDLDHGTMRIGTVPPPSGTTTTGPSVATSTTTSTVPPTTTTPGATGPPAPLGPHHPADTGIGSPNFRISPSEVLTYAAAFLAGDAGVFPGISAANRNAFVMRAAAIHMANFQGRYEDVGTEFPDDSPQHPQRWQALPDTGAG